jgi:acetolactate synthase-1/3 small subunit/acetolactate synthase II small subunit
MTGEIVIDFNRTEGSVLRLIGMVERKGFDVTSVIMPRTAAASSRLTLGIAARDAGRRFDTLSRHVAKVYGVTGVQATEHQTPLMERAS